MGGVSWRAEAGLRGGRASPSQGSSCLERGREMTRGPPGAPPPPILGSPSRFWGSPRCWGTPPQPPVPWSKLSFLAGGVSLSPSMSTRSPVASASLRVTSWGGGGTQKKGRVRVEGGPREGWGDPQGEKGRQGGVGDPGGGQGGPQRGQGDPGGGGGLRGSPRIKRGGQGGDGDPGGVRGTLEGCGDPRRGGTQGDPQNKRGGQGEETETPGRKKRGG